MPTQVRPMTDPDAGPSATTLAVEVVYALPHRQWRVALRLPEGSTAAAAVAAADLESRVGSAVAWQGMLGIFGERVADDQPLKTGDRVEINRPLVHDPMEARRLRASGELQHHRATGDAANLGDDDAEV